MATLKITLENGFFVKSNNVHLESIEPTHVVGNGWDCIIRSDGSIECNSIRNYSDGIHSVRYSIKTSGFAKLTRKKPGEKIEVLKKGFVIPRGSKLSSGTLGLAGGYVDSRYAFFRDNTFQKFLDEHDISAVQRENPNRFFTLRSAEYGGGSCKSSIHTDGTVHSIQSSIGRSGQWKKEYPSTCAYEGEEIVSVTGATWVLHKQFQHEGDKNNCFRILYTLRNPISIVDIPTKK